MLQPDRYWLNVLYFPFSEVTPITAVEKVLDDGVLVTFLLAVGGAALTGWGLVRLRAVNRAMVRETWVEPVADFFRHYGVHTGLYRISDIVLGVVSNVFYQDMGFSKPEIATAVKTFGVVVSIAGSFLGGLLATRFNVMRILMLCRSLVMGQ